VRNNSSNLVRTAKEPRINPAVVIVLALLWAAPAPAESRAERAANELLARMTLEEKIGQMVQADMNAVKDKNDISKYGFGSMLSGGDSDPADIRAEGWNRSCEEFQTYALKSRLKIPLIYGIDAVHGHNNVDGAVVFPQNIGLGATRNPKLVRKAAEVTAREIAATGMHWGFAPCVAAAQNERWGRTYESFSESPDLAGELGAAAVKGFQSKLPQGNFVLACPKHYLGDGGTQDGVDQGNVVCDEATLRKLHLAPYLPSLKAKAGSIMVSYSSWNGQKMHGNKYLLTDVLKKELGFEGFLVSDWAAIDQIDPDYKSAVEKSINAGLDMAMIPNGPGQKNNYLDFINHTRQLVAEGKIPLSRIDDAVRRILRVKIQMGVFEHPFGDPKLLAEVGSAAHRKVARECVRESVVLLKNDRKTLPLSRKLQNLAVVGAAADDLGVQCGGWTVTWQGKSGTVMSGGTTLLAAIRKTVSSDTRVTYSASGDEIAGADAVVVVVGELPYAEMKGDRADLRLAPADAALIQKVKQAGKPTVTILLSGRPLVLGSALDASDAFLAAWLPGTEGQGVADVLFGEAKPKGKLPRTWPRNNDQLGLTVNSIAASLGEPQFPFGYGLSW
jgi:beta-glucosidase